MLTTAATLADEIQTRVIVSLGSVTLWSNTISVQPHISSLYHQHHTRLTFPNDRCPPSTPHSRMCHIRELVQRAFNRQALLLELVLRRLVLGITLCIDLVSSCAEECAQTLEGSQYRGEQVGCKRSNFRIGEAQLTCRGFVGVGCPGRGVLWGEVSLKTGGRSGERTRHAI